MSPDKALQILLDGNKRFVANKLSSPLTYSERRIATTDLQKPIAVILGCSDSRAAPEIVFDQTIGKLFVVRVAGNVVCNTEMESLLFGIDYLETPLLVVLGHQSCGAVSAVLDNQIADIPTIAAKIQPAIDGLELVSDNILEDAIKNNARHCAKKLAEQKVLHKRISAGKLKIISAYYSFSTGLVEKLS